MRPSQASAVRIAPSPTGPLHIGTARTALFNYLFARHAGGTFVLRLEDTDVGPLDGRVRAATSSTACTGWASTGTRVRASAGEPERGPYGPYRQMERLPRYAAAAERLLAEDQAYHCYCTPEELDAERKRPGGGPPAAALQRPLRPPDARPSGRAFEAEGRRPAIRFRIEPGVVAFDDLVRGHVEIDAARPRRRPRHRPRPTARRSTTSRSSSTTRRWRSAT